FAAGGTAQTGRVALINDSVAETSEAFNLVLSSVVNATAVDTAATATIGANDAVTVATPHITADAIIINQGQPYIKLVVRLDAASATNVRVNYTTTDETADRFNDYDGQSGTLEFAPGEVLKTVRIGIDDDLTVEAKENFGLLLSSPVNGTIQGREAIAT